MTKPIKEKLRCVYFNTSSDFREWLMKNHDKEKELLVGFHKVKTKKESITWSQSVDQAICFGWIDGVRRSIDQQHYCIRFSPRKPASTWSAVNIRKVEDLTSKGLMHPKGTEAFKRRSQLNSQIYSYEQAAVAFEKCFEKDFKANQEAWEFFDAMPPSYKRAATHWVMTAKRDETKRRRLEELIKDSRQRKKIKLLDY